MLQIARFGLKVAKLRVSSPKTLAHVSYLILTRLTREMEMVGQNAGLSEEIVKKMAHEELFI